MNTTANGSAGASAGESATAPPAHWVRAGALAGALNVNPRRLREYVRRAFDESDGIGTFDRPTGGVELWLSAAVAEAVRRHYGATAPAHAPADAPADTSPDAPAHADDSADAWRELVAELRVDRDRLRSELATERVALQEALRRAEGAELARHAAETRVEALKAAWWRWLALARQHVGAARWFRPVRDLPEPPAELVADRLLAKPKEPQGISSVVS